MKCFLHSKRLLVSIILSTGFLFSNTVFAQVAKLWVRFHDDQANSHNSATAMVTDGAGNIYVTGSDFQLSGPVNTWMVDYVTIKYNKFGTLEWVARYDLDNGWDYAVAIAVSKSGNLYVTGYSYGNGTTTDIVTVKYNKAGVQQWAARFNGPGDDYDRAYSIQVDNNDNAYIVGYSVRVKGSTPDYVTIKYNSSGVQQWARYHDGAANSADLAFAMVVDTTTSDIYITGSTAFDYSGESSEDYTTVKYNSAGEEQWVRDYKGPGHTQDEGKVMAIDGLGNVYVSGFTFGGDTVGCVTVGYDPSGNTKWVAHYSGPSNIMAQPGAIIADRFGNVYVTGFAVDVPNGLDCFTIKYNNAGVQQWVKLYNNSFNGRHEGKALALDVEGNVYVGGVSTSSNADNDLVTIKYSKDGVEQWIERYDAFNSSENIAAIAVNNFNEVIVAGSTSKNTGATYANSYYLTIKYVQPEPLIVTATADTTIYYGYGSNCLSLKANVTGGVAPYRFIWTPAGITPNDLSIFVCPTATTVYKVIVKDAVGTTDSAQVAVKVIDVRCGDKIIVCHNGKELCIASQAVATHLRHGDKLGSCSVNMNDCDKLKDITSGNGKLPFIFKAYPNPFSDVSTIIYQLPIDAQVSISIVDVYGREIKTIVREKKVAGYYFAFVDDKKLTPGTYLCKMVISSPPCQSVQTLKLIVAR